MPRPSRYVSRADLGWGTSPATRANPRSGLVIHYDSANQGLAAKNHSACIQYWRDTRSFHTGPSRGWADIGYSFMACAHGYVLEGRGLYRTQAAQPGGNTSHYSCTLATGPDDEITPEQINAVRALRQWLMEPDTSIAGAVLGHRDFIATSCPGDRAYDLVRDGTFTQPPGAPTNTTEDTMPAYFGLKKGDSGELVKLLQLRIKRAGFSAAMVYPGGPSDGVDSDYGDGTAEGVRLCREYVGSAAEAHFGDLMTAYACDQVEAAVTKRALEKALAGLSSGGTGGALPATAEISGTVNLRGA
ncbi:peptidoglycan recognition protein family protein [Nocardiopsis synnemataformans]|uniref:peptidoglycan recognition protein family protein n=1 Tax=Nocardiopsis synnemataformans TaxID=61305 RepID=UPI003EBA216A